MLSYSHLQARLAADQTTEQTIALKDGGQLVIQKSGAVIHTDAKGNCVKMINGKIMEAKDGSKIMMKNNTLWQTVP